MGFMVLDARELPARTHTPAQPLRLHQSLTTFPKKQEP